MSAPVDICWHPFGSKLTMAGTLCQSSHSWAYEAQNFIAKTRKVCIQIGLIAKSSEQMFLSSEQNRKKHTLFELICPCFPHGNRGPKRRSCCCQRAVDLDTDKMAKRKRCPFSDLKSSRNVSQLCYKKGLNFFETENVWPFEAFRSNLSQPPDITKHTFHGRSTGPEPHRDRCLNTKCKAGRERLWFGKNFTRILQSELQT